MQEFEIVILVVSLIYLLFNRKLNTKKSRPYILGILILALGLHLILEGFRWQMIPAYLLWLISFFTVIRFSENKAKRWQQILKGIGLIFLTIMAVILPSLFPVFELPENTGEFYVGTRDIYLELEREEVITPEKTDKRKIMIKAWYPSLEATGIEDPYIDEAGRTGFAQKYGLPGFMFDYLDKVTTNVYRESELAPGAFPVLVFSHGYNSKANGYYALLSEIVSHGYIVLAINHTYESTGTSFPTGEQEYFDYEFAQQIESDTWHQMEPVIEAFNSDLSFEQRHPIIKKGLTTYFVKDMVERWSTDIIDVVNELDNWNQTGFLRKHLDLNKIGVFGHSRGGGAAGDAALKDPRIQAGVNIDGVQWGDIVDSRFQKPFLFISADWPEDHEDLNQHAYVNRSSSVFYEALIKKTGHSNFMDIPFMLPLNSISGAGEIDPYQGMEITNRLVRSFFDKHLKHKDLDLANLDTEYSLLVIQSYNGDTQLSEKN
ncbi:hypothetical protein MKO06_13065 [Gramella sp. GC03-9]|uniref:Platelet-activating factor acetylhydrolase n=1 Tax=Christiangramia oceanisediminis TaxID=2920386 RepID=A0A9X2RB27_9FLAO|nr:hypothetical protein [Gramella oceanisediminis]MCP9200844.1 hypothetical protein [Gramella oceanisediminis]